MNPFIELYHDPVGVLAAVAYTVLLLALTVWTAALAANFVDRGWKHAVWLGNAWEWRGNDQQFGPEWEWYLPPAEVANRVTLLGIHAGAVAFIVAVDLFAIGAIVYLVSP